MSLHPLATDPYNIQLLAKEICFTKIDADADTCEGLIPHPFHSPDFPQEKIRVYIQKAPGKLGFYLFFNDTPVFAEPEGAWVIIEHVESFQKVAKCAN